MIESGKTLQQRYRIDRQIGQGGMGAVYIATDERFGSTVAIKETLYMDDNFRKAIEREARLLNSLKHSALPRVSDHFEEDNGQFLVMEYIPGDDVGSMLDPEHPRFTVEQILKWADQLLDALDYLHNQVIPVIHRDIKPQNLKITPRGDMILLDFGLAKGNPTDAGQHATAAKSIFGYSRNYASLEQIQGTGTDPRSDLYSLAATIYHLLTNNAPEDALTRAMAVLSNKPDPLLPANAVDPKIPRGLAGVLQKAMALNADERPSTAAEMREMLRENEKYAYLADAATVAARTNKTEASGQATEIMPQGTRVGAHGAEAKTEVLPPDFGEMTAVRSGTSPASPTQAGAVGLTSVQPKRTGRMMTAAAVVLIAVGAAVGGGLYFGTPYFTRANSTTAEPVQPVRTEAQLPVAADTNAEVPSQGSGAEPSAQANSAQTAETAKQQAKTDKTKAQTSGKTNDESDTSVDTSDMADIPEVDVREVPGGVDIVKTQNGKMTITHVDTVPKGFNPIPPDVERMLRNLDTSKMTPQQREKLQRMMTRQKQQQMRKQQQNSHPQTPVPPDQ